MAARSATARQRTDSGGDGHTRDWLLLEAMRDTTSQLVDAAIRDCGNDVFRLTLRAKDIAEVSILLELLNRRVVDVGADETALGAFLQAWRVAERDRPARESNVIDQVTWCRRFMARMDARIEGRKEGA